MPQFASKISSLEVYKIINYLFTDEKRGKSTEPNTEVRRCKRNYKCVGFAKPPSSANEADDKSISSYGQNGQRPAKNRKPSFHFVVVEWKAVRIYFR